MLLPELAGYLGHTRGTIGHVERHTQDLDETAFAQNARVQDAAIRNLEIISKTRHNMDEHHLDRTVPYP